jgi:hypothetical protein
MTRLGDHGLWMADPRLAAQLWHRIRLELMVLGCRCWALAGGELVLTRKLLHDAARYGNRREVRYAAATLFV